MQITAAFLFVFSIGKKIRTEVLTSDNDDYWVKN